MIVMNIRYSVFNRHWAIVHPSKFGRLTGLLVSFFVEGRTEHNFIDPVKYRVTINRSDTCKIVEVYHHDDR